MSAPRIATPAALQCRICGQQYPVEPLTICEECFGPLEPAYDLQSLDGDDFMKQVESGPASLWRYESLLPHAPAELSHAFGSGTWLLLGLRRTSLERDRDAGYPPKAHPLMACGSRPHALTSDEEGGAVPPGRHAARTA